jgi:hypothetical protein
VNSAALLAGTQTATVEVVKGKTDVLILTEVVLPPKQPLRLPQFRLEAAERSICHRKTAMRTPSRPKRKSRCMKKCAPRTNMRLPVIWEGPEQEAVHI